MNETRWNNLMNGSCSLTAEEIREGWHFCPDWDYLLIGPDCEETEPCTCTILGLIE